MFVIYMLFASVGLMCVCHSLCVLHVVTSGPILQPFSLCDPAASTDIHTACTTEAGLDQQQLPEQSSSRAEAAADQKASAKQEPEDHTPIVAPSAESIRQGIMEARSQAYIPAHTCCICTCFYWALKASCLSQVSALIPTLGGVETQLDALL